MKGLLPLFTLLFMAGIACAHFCKITFFLAACLAAISALMGIFFLRKDFAGKCSLGLASFLFGFLLLTNAQSIPRCHIANFIPPFCHSPMVVRGIIVDDPQEKRGVYSFVLRVCQLQSDKENRSCCADILVRARSAQEFRYWDELVLRGTLQQIAAPGYTGANSYQSYLFNRGILFMMKVKNEADIQRLQTKRISLRRFACRVRKYSSGIFSRYTSSLTAPVLRAMVLGDKKDIPYFINDVMIRSGTVHILVVSGFNVGIVCFIVILLLKLMRINKNLRIIIAIPVLFFYCLLTGVSTPVVRSTVMAVIFLLAYLAKRDTDMRHSLSIAAIFVLINDPRQLFDASFQLSFASVASLVFLYPRLRVFLRPETLKAGPLQFIIDAFIVSLCAWLATCGFIVYYFGIFSPVTVVANIFIVPLATLITLAGFGMIAMHFLSPFLAQIFATSCELLAFLILKINIFLIHLPYAYFRLS